MMKAAPIEWPGQRLRRNTTRTKKLVSGKRGRVLEDNPPQLVRAAVLVAHPDDETLWAGGVILTHPDWDWYIASLCRASDPDRAPRFARVVAALNATGVMADVDDSSELLPVPAEDIQLEITRLVNGRAFDLIFTHGPKGEYTSHPRHEQVSEAVLKMWKFGSLVARRLYMFAYTDHRRSTLPQAIPEADCKFDLPEEIWQKKYDLITGLYGFDPQSWEARTTPRREAFWLKEKDPSKP